MSVLADVADSRDFVKSTAMMRACCYRSPSLGSAVFGYLVSY